MDRMPLVSILSSVYNERSYIEQTVNSVLKQTYQKWEWIIVDDGSTDGTAEILKGIKDERIKYVPQENSGRLAKNLNRALKICSGDIIAALDGDDYWPENKLEIQVKSFEDPDVVLSYGECVLINPKGKRLGHIGLIEDSAIACNNPQGTALKRFLVDIDCFIANTTVLYRKQSLTDVGGFVETNGLPHDFPTWIKLSLAGRFAPLPVPLGYYRKHMKSVSFHINQEDYFRNQVIFLTDLYRQNLRKLRDIGLCFDLEALEQHWGRIRRKNQIIYRLMLLSLFTRIDFINPLICFVNRNSYIKKSLKRFLGI